jgi:hypothetical protein
MTRHEALHALRNTTWIALGLLASLAPTGCGDDTATNEGTGSTMNDEATSDTSDESTSDTSDESTSDTSSESTSDTSDESTSDTSSESTSDTSDESTSDTEEESTTGDPPVNLFLNPSFEVWTEAGLNTRPDDWTNCTTMAGLGVETVPDACTATPDQASDGARYARGWNGEGIKQTISTTPGMTYRVTLDTTAVTGCYGGDPSSAWDVVVDGVTILTTPLDTNPGWMTAEVTFVAESATTEICLRKALDEGQGGLDNVSVTLD